MTVAYVDSSCLVAIAFTEPGAQRLAARLAAFDRLVSSNLLEAELRAAFAREAVPADPEPLMSGLTWVYPDRPLTREFQVIAAAGYLRGADLWHLACALFLAPAGAGLVFLTLDTRQAQVASVLGFARA